MDEIELWQLIHHLADAWKSHFDLYTQYVGYLSPEQMKTLFVLKRESDEYGLFDLSDLNLGELNRKASECGIWEFGHGKDIESVLPVLYKELNKHDFSDIDEKTWSGLMAYLASKK